MASPLPARGNKISGQQLPDFFFENGMRRDNQDEVRQAKLASSSRCKSGLGKG
jgi:hypothetical protein